MKPKKSLGQHFLKCGWVISALLEAAEIKSEDKILEIGPGTGVLTRALAKHAQEVIAVEKDEKLAEALEESLKKEEIGNVKIIKGDILKILSDINPVRAGAARPADGSITLPSAISLFDRRPASPKLQRGEQSRRRSNGVKNFKVVANIPYYLTSRLLRILLEKEPRPNLIVLTMQKEVAQRITAQPPQMNPARDKTPQASAAPRVRASGGMNLLALSVQVFGRPEIIKAVPASCFWPKPKVDSAIIKITNFSEDFFAEKGLAIEKFFQITKTAFGQKRKLLTSSLAKIVPKESLKQILRGAKISLKARPEELSLKQWSKIILGIEKLRVKP